MKKSFLISFLMASVMLNAGCQDNSYEYPFQNPNLKVEKRVDNLLSLLTPQEKIGLMMNGSISIDRRCTPAVGDLYRRVR